jgi:hypothetical protein
MRALIISTAILAASVARAEPPKPTDMPAAEMSSADAQTWVAFLDKLVDKIVANANTCDKMASEVSAVIDENHDAIAVAEKARARHLTLPAEAQQHIIVTIRKALPAMQNCADNDKVQAALAKLEVKNQEAQD